MIIFATMLVQTAPIQGLKRTDYDDLLAMGWFRGTGIIYRSEVVCIDEQVYGIRNIRFPVQSFSMRRSHAKLYRRNMRRFTIRVGTPQVDARREELYQGHVHRFKAFVHETLQDILLSPRMGAEIDAMEIAVYDDGKLVAVSYVDVGECSMASILCLYDQHYANFSLGTFTMLLEMDMAKRLGLDYYYPGYVLDLPSAFDYKLQLGPCEWLDQACGWQWSQATQHMGRAELIRLKLDELALLLNTAGYQPSLFIYPYYTLGHLIADRPDLVRVPAFYTLQAGITTFGLSYDIELNRFVLFDVLEADEMNYLHQLQLSADYRDGDNYVLQTLCSTFCEPLDESRFSDHLHYLIHTMTDAATVGA